MNATSQDIFTHRRHHFAAELHALRWAAETMPFGEDQRDELRSMARKVFWLYGEGRHEFDVDDLVNDAYLNAVQYYARYHRMPDSRVLLRRMTDYVKYRVRYYQDRKQDLPMDWDYWLSDDPLPGQAMEDAEFAQWLARGLTRWEATVVWARLRDSDEDKRWGRIAQRLGSTECAVKLAYSHGVHRLRKRMAESLERN